MGIAAESVRPARVRTVARLALFAALAAGAFFAGRAARSLAAAPARTQAPPSGPAGADRASTPPPRSGAPTAPPGARADPLAPFLAESAPHRRNIALWSALRAADENTVRAWLAATDAWPDIPARTAARHLIFRRWGELAPTAALAFIAGLPRNERDKATEPVVRGWSTAEPVAAFDWATMSGPSAEPFRLAASTHSIFESLAENRRYAELASRAAALPNRSMGMEETLAGRIAGGWAEHEPEAAFMWVESLPDDWSKRNATFPVLDTIGRESPDLALNFAKTLRPGEDRANAISGVIARWSEQDPAGALAAIESRLAPADRDEARARHLVVTVPADPRLAVDRLAAITSPDVRASTAKEMWQKLDRIDQPALALEVALRWLPETDRPTATRNIVRAWRHRDPAAAERFLRDSAFVTPAIRDDLQHPAPPRP